MTQDKNNIIKSNLSEAWLEAFEQLIEPSVKSIAPLSVTVTGINNGQAAEHSDIRQTLDAALEQIDKPSCQTVANTIFPRSLWNRSQDRQDLFDRYLYILPRIKQDPANRYGVYFERLIAFGLRGGDLPVNQLDHIIRTYLSGNHRHSALQAGIFDPCRDHSNQRQRGFPCLQQIAFNANHQKEELVVTGFYAKQYVFEKAYGNYLGLCALGEFMAHEMGLELKQVTCIASVAELGRSIGKREAQNLLETLLNQR